MDSYISDISIYDGIFQAWDGLGKGYIGGETAIEIFSQSGLAREDMERIWYLPTHVDLISGLWRILGIKENLIEMNLQWHCIWYGVPYALLTLDLPSVEWL
jgi:hypothetical protein